MCGSFIHSLPLQYSQNQAQSWPNTSTPSKVMLCVQQPFSIDRVLRNWPLVLMKYGHTELVKQEHRILQAYIFRADGCAVMAEKEPRKHTRFQPTSSAVQQYQGIQRHTTHNIGRGPNRATTQNAVFEPSELAWDAWICLCRWR